MRAEHEANRKLWNIWADKHRDSAFYNVPAFLAGHCTLLPAERELLGDVRGKRLLHLQCHFGLDTLSWARRGAEVTGVDISDRAIAHAQALSEEAGLPARFIRADLFDLPNVLDETFDIVFTSYGTIGWLSDLAQWGRIAAQYVRPGGRFCIVEIHPFLSVLGPWDAAAPEDLRVQAPYFRDGAPERSVETTSYAMRPGETHPETECFEWLTTFSGVQTALIDAGLQITKVREYPWCCYAHFPFMTRRDDGTYAPPPPVNLPFLFGILAHKSA
ncbi:MAG: class I SAM-dependent methyltransferase [FCB group bacterium]|jgi:SAM-dependent methyltransferase|nr:class I SAM-dependent methyltransferase [FCB group bacterium]